VRKIIALTAAAGLLVTLAACSTSAPSGACEPTTASGDASSLVTTTGSFGKDPAAAFPTPLIAKQVETSTLTTGEGAMIYPGQYAETQISLYDGETGSYLTSTSYDEAQPFLVRAGEGSGNIGPSLECQTIGSRVAVAATGSDLYGFAGIAKDALAADATFVIVFDIQGSILGKAYGVEQVPQQGMPSVVVAPGGEPGVTVPGEEPPTTLKISVLKQGDGAVLAEGDFIFAHYLRVDWSDPKSAVSMKSTWANFGTPELLSLSDLDPTTGLGVTTGVLQALVGQKVGTQVLVVVPPSFGFPDGSAPDGVDATATLVYVFDILGVVK
jgi:peptidylprolyl isomerase